MGCLMEGPTKDVGGTHVWTSSVTQKLVNRVGWSDGIVCWRLRSGWV